MRLIGYGPGELLDRLTILALKIHHGEAEQAYLGHWKEERTELFKTLDLWKDWAIVRDATLLFTIDLTLVNSLLWRAEDDLRAWRKQGWDTIGAPEAIEVADLGFRIQALNDRRAGIVMAINTAAGFNPDHREKLTGGGAP